jgi:hypothetical protein
MTWMGYFYAISGAVLASGYVAYRAYRWYQWATARQAAQDAAALVDPHPAMPKAKFGAKFRTHEMGQPHDQAKAAVAHKLAKLAEKKQRKVAASRAPVVKVAQPKPAKVRDFRKVAK